MNRESLRKHCEKMCKMYETAPSSNAYMEHKLVLDLLEQTRWISCSERLPEEGQKVLVTDRFETVTTAIYFKKSPFWREVVAWRELPEPYKESEVSNAK